MFFKNIFGCISNGNDTENCNINNNEIDDIKDRLSRLEMKYDSLHDILRDIKMSIELIKMRLDILQH